MDILALINTFAEGLSQISLFFYEHPEMLASVEQQVADLSHKTAADFLSRLLTEMDESIAKSNTRKDRYRIQRKKPRTLISTVGDITFTHTQYYDTEEKRYRCLLDEMIKLPDHERFTVLAESKALYEAEVHSYQHAADSLHIGNQTVSKVAVMNKVHAITEELPDPKCSEKKKCKYLYIEADEDHIHKQHQGEVKGCMIGKLIYVYEGKADVCEGKRILISPHYHGGLYKGGDQNSLLWEEVQGYIETHYDTKALKQVYISGDGGAWIKAGIEHVDKSVFVLDRFHLMKYINRAARLTLDDQDTVKGKFYKYIYKNKPKKLNKLLDKIYKVTGKSDVVEDVRTYINSNWDGIQLAFHDKHVLGCSAEGHVSNVYSERMSSRPMGWSECGGDRMCRLRCYVRNYGVAKIIDLVEYKRSMAMNLLKATGTEDLIPVQEKHRRLSQWRKSSAAYIDRIQATIPGYTVKKTLAIRERLNNI